MNFSIFSDLDEVSVFHFQSLSHAVRTSQEHSTSHQGCDSFSDWGNDWVQLRLVQEMDHPEVRDCQVLCDKLTLFFFLALI